LDPKQTPKPEDFQTQWKKVADYSSPQYPTSANDSIALAVANLSRAKL
jgi:hypothetical protein